MSSKKTQALPDFKLIRELWEEGERFFLATADDPSAHQSGTVQKVRPSARSLRELLLASRGIALTVEHAEQLSQMLHSESESLSSIQGVLNKQPVSALTLATLIRLERAREPGEIEKRAARVALAREAAEALHNKPGGSREKQNAIQALWATGKYSSRDICAEQECAALGMSYSSARKALRNTPNPT